MATNFHDLAIPHAAPDAPGTLTDPARAIIGPRRDAILIWGAPLAAFLLVQAWVQGWAMFAPQGLTEAAVIGLFAAVAVLTWAHLIAVVPRAYLNPDVFAAYRTRLIVAPVALLALLFVSPTALAVGVVLAVFWDVHHSAMQNFGFARLYDMKAGNPPTMLRATDLRLNWMLYVGPLAASAALATHLDYFAKLDGTAMSALTRLPGVFAAHHDGVRIVAVALYLATIAWAVFDYARAMGHGYRLPAHKLATLVVTGAVSVLAWGFTPPLVALATINLYHAVQYFALVWVKEGKRMRGRGTARRAALLFAGGCILFGLAYWAAAAATPAILLAPFIACSLLHFWYDGFVWSVRKKQM